LGAHCIAVIVGPAKLDCYILPLDIAGLSKTLAEGCHAARRHID
jgi:hypothetical protein